MLNITAISAFDVTMDDLNSVLKISLGCRLPSVTHPWSNSSKYCGHIAMCGPCAIDDVAAKTNYYRSFLVNLWNQRVLLGLHSVSLLVLVAVIFLSFCCFIIGFFVAWKLSYSVCIKSCSLEG